MGERNNNDLFFTCSLIEYIGREEKKNQAGSDRLPGEKYNQENI